MNSTESDVPVSDEPPARPKPKAKGKPAGGKQGAAAPKTARPRTLAEVLKADKPSVVAYAALGMVALAGLAEWPVAAAGAGLWFVARRTR